MNGSVYKPRPVSSNPGKLVYCWVCVTFVDIDEFIAVVREILVI